VPRRDCIPRCGRAHAPTRNRAGGDQHPAGRVAQQEENLAGESTLEAATGLDRRADDDELGAALGSDARDLLPETSGPRANDLPPHRDPVGGRHRGRGLEPLLQAHVLPVEVCVDRQLALEHGRCDEDDPGTAVGSEPAREIQCVLRLLPVEEWHDDGAIGDRARPAREAARPAVEQVYVREPHRMSW
jgi:hypothetical protein